MELELPVQTWSSIWSKPSDAERNERYAPTALRSDESVKVRYIHGEFKRFCLGELEMLMPELALGDMGERYLLNDSGDATGSREVIKVPNSSGLQRNPFKRERQSSRPVGFHFSLGHCHQLLEPGFDGDRCLKWLAGGTRTGTMGELVNWSTHLSHRLVGKPFLKPFLAMSCG